MLRNLAENMAEISAENDMIDLIPKLQEQGLLDTNIDNSDDVHEILGAIRQNKNNKLFIFDCECIESDEDYAGLFHQLATQGGMASEISEIVSSYDYENEKATIRCSIKGESIEQSWHQRSDYVSEDFFAWANDIFAQYFDRQMVSLPAEDQCAEIFFTDATSATEMQAAFDQQNGRLDSEKILTYQVLLICVLSFLSIIPLSYLASMFFGFWPSLLLGAGVGLLCGFGMCLWTVAQDEADKEFEQELLDNPELIGKMALEYMNELKSAKG